MHSTTVAEPLDDHDLLTRHDEKIKTLEQHAADTSKKMDWLIALIITTLIAAITNLLKH